MDMVQLDPALPFGEQLQPGEDAPELKVVLAGTVSVRTTPSAGPVPVLLTWIW